jgi:hypothetical protein
MAGPGSEKTQFKKGVSGNPEGGRRHNPIRKAIKKLTIEVYARVIETALTGNVDALKDIMNDPKSSVVEVGVATALVTAMQKGDAYVLEHFASRIVGKLPEIIRVDSNSEVNVNVKLDMQKIKAAIKKFESEV